MKELKELLSKWRQLTSVDLRKELEELNKQQFKLKMQQSIGELKSLHKIAITRKNIARVLTILKEKEAK